MSTAPKIEDNKKEVNLNNNEEALIIRKIYSLFEENRNKDTGNNKKSIYELDNNKSINLNNLNNIIAESIMIKTSDAIVVKRRFEIWNKTLESIIKDDKADVRLFTKEFKQRLYDNNPTCSICGQNINSVDDAAVDHIEQYWMGGKTIPDNARLTHRYCNNSRPRNEN